MAYRKLVDNTNVKEDCDKTNFYPFKAMWSWYNTNALHLHRGRSRVWKGGVHFAEKLKAKKNKVTAIMAVLYQMYIL